MSCYIHACIIKCFESSKTAIGGFELHIWSYGMILGMSWSHEIVLKMGKKIENFDIWIESPKIVLIKIWLAKIFITLCFTISQPYFACRTHQRKALGIWTSHSKSTILGYIQYILIWDELSRGVLTKIFFSKSSHHAEHFSYLWCFFKMNTSEATSDWNLLEKRDF